MKQTKKISRKVISYVLALVMVFSTMTGIVPGMSLTAKAESYNDLNTNDTTVQIEGVKIGDTIVDWYVIGYDSDDQTVTLLSKQSFGSQAFNSSQSNSYENSTIKNFVEGLIGDGQPLAGIKDALADINGKVTGNPSTISGKVPYLLSYTEASVLSVTKIKGDDNITYWWLRSPGSDYRTAAYVRAKRGQVREGGDAVITEHDVRPALQLDLSKVTFDSNNNTFSVGSPKTNQTVTAPTAATNLTYTGQEQALLTGGATVATGNTEATVQYSLTPTDDNSWVEGYANLKAKNAGTYKVYYRVAGNDTYADFVSSDEQAVTVKIAKANPETPTGMTGKYRQKLSTVSLSDGWSWVDGDTIMNAGVGDYTYKANYNPTDATNYKSLSDVDLTVKVGKGDGTISLRV